MAKSRQLSASGPIYGALRAAASPMTAYQILDAVRDQGITAPPTVYRALNRLVEQGLAHRVESLNAYVACAHQQHGDEAAIFAICENCGRVEEVAAAESFAVLREAAGANGFQVEHSAVELRGLCGVCVSAGVVHEDVHHRS